MPEVATLLTAGGLGAFVKVLVDLLKKFRVLKTEGAETVGVVLALSLILAFAAGWVKLGLSGETALQFFMLGIGSAAIALGVDTLGNAVLKPERV